MTEVLGAIVAASALLAVVVFDALRAHGLVLRELEERTSGQTRQVTEGDRRDGDRPPVAPGSETLVQDG
jgi:hypothetical protein